MTITLKPLEFTGHPDHITLFTISENSWKILKCFSSESPKSNFHDDIRNLQAIDHSKAKNMFVTLGQKCESGIPLNELYPIESLHAAHTFSYTNHDGEHVIDNIWRIRQGDLRLYFIYLSNKRIALLHLWYKRKNQLSMSEKKQLETLAIAVIQSKK